MHEEANVPRVSVALTFDFDALSPWLQLSTASPSARSRGEFGPVGVERIRRVLDDFEVPATFFTPGHTALAYPASVESLVADGHEIGHHGWVHESLGPLPEPEQRRAIERGLEALEEVASVRPSGFRAPGWDLGPGTVDLLVEYGFSYDSSMMGHDFSPYWCRSGDVATDDEPFVFGAPVDLVEVPVAWHLDDFPSFEFVPGVGNLSGTRSVEDVLAVWQAEFAFLHEDVGRGCMVVTMHPQSTGRGHRIRLLQGFVEYVLAHRGAAFVRTCDVATRFRADHPSPS